MTKLTGKSNLLIFAFTVLTFLMKPVFVPAAEDPAFEEILEMILARNADLDLAEAGIDLAFQGYRGTVASGRPQISVVTDSFTNPLYSYRSTAVTGFAGREIIRSHTAGLGLKIDQYLPTGGSAGLLLKDSFSVSSSDGGPTGSVAAEFRFDPEEGAGARRTESGDGRTGPGAGQDFGVGPVIGGARNR